MKLPINIQVSMFMICPIVMENIDFDFLNNSAKSRQDREAILLIRLFG